MEKSTKNKMTGFAPDQVCTRNLCSQHEDEGSERSGTDVSLNGYATTMFRSMAMNYPAQ